MDNLSNPRELRPRRILRRRVPREGKITLVTICAILGMIVMAGFVGNSGHVVTTKVATQNAADSITFSSAQWMARGMNAVTATNHLLGEITSLVVVVEALGGPEADLGMKAYPPEPQGFDEANKGVGDLWVPKGGYGAGAYGGAEKPVIGAIVDLVSPKDAEKAKFKAFATIYDSKLLLKKELLKFLLIKSVANVGFMVPMPIGIATAIAAYVVHIYSSYQIINIGIEYLIMEGLELLVSNLGDFKVELIENLAIPAIAAHGDFIAGKPPAGIDIGTGVVNHAVGDTLDHLKNVYNVDAQIFPAAADFKLPIEAEPAPSLQGGGADEDGWGVDENLTATLDSEIEEKMKEQQDKMSDPKKKLNDRITALEESITGGDDASPPEGLNGLEAKLKEKLNKNPTPEDAAKFNQEITEIGNLRTEKNARIKLLRDQLAKIDAQFIESRGAIDKAKTSLQNAVPGNLSSNNIPRQFMNQAEERTTQWVRATYPYVDAFRAPVLAQFKEHLEISEAEKHYRKWTNRYTLIKAWKFRSGYTLVKDSDEKAHWEEGSESDRLAMYVMKGAYDKNAKRLNKGHETWTEDTNEGHREAEQMFTVIGMTQRPIQPLFSPIVYPLATDGGITTFAQAIFYNGNEQSPPAADAKEKLQAKIGWDTLNWDPTAPTPEWGPDASTSDAEWPWEIFTRSPDRVGTARVKLNWQAKLMPVTSTRFNEAAAADFTNADMEANVTKAKKYFEPLVTH